MSDEVVTDAAPSPGHSVKIDWRTGKPMVAYDDAFWQDHERRRVEQGLSIRQYCATHGLALSTYRHRVSGRKRGDAARPAPGATAVPPFVEVTRSQPAAAVIEVVVQGLTLRLTGEPAQQVLSRVLERGRFTDPARVAGNGIAMSELVAWLEGIDLSRVRRLSPLEVSTVV